MKIILIFILPILLVNGDLFCQTRIITGRIISENFESVPVVSIQDKDTTLIGKTDLNGRFNIEISSLTDSLLFSFVGFEWTTIQFTNDCDILEIVMMVDVIYDFMPLRKIDRLRLKRFKELPKIHKLAYDRGLFVTEQPCYKQEFEYYRNK